MTWLPPIATSNVDILIGVVAMIAWVVVQIMGKAAKNKPPPTDRMPGGARPGDAPDNSAPVGDPAEEMRRFFQRLERAATSDAVPPNIPATTAQADPERGLRTTAGSRAVTSSGQAITSSSQRTAARRELEQHATAVVPLEKMTQAGSEVVPSPLDVSMSVATVTAGAFAETQAHEGRLAFVRRLRCVGDLRQAVAMMEVLSPPLGMRHTPFPIG